MSFKIYKEVLNFDLKYRTNYEWNSSISNVIIPPLALFLNFMNDIFEISIISISGRGIYIPYFIRVNEYSLYRELTISRELLGNALIKYYETREEKYLDEILKWYSPSTLMLIDVKVKNIKDFVSKVIEYGGDYIGSVDETYLYRFVLGIEVIPSLVYIAVSKGNGDLLREDVIEDVLTLASLNTMFFMVRAYNVNNMYIKTPCLTLTLEDAINTFKSEDVNVEVVEDYPNCDKYGQFIDNIQDFEEIVCIGKDSKGTILIVTENKERTKYNIVKLVEKIKTPIFVTIVSRW